MMTFFGQDRDHLTDEGPHTTHNLHSIGAIETNLIECQAQEVLPTRKGNEDSDLAIRVAKRANF